MVSENSILIEEELKKFNTWRKKVTEKLPELATRVFALRNKFYDGCGFHWSMEKSLGKVISLTNDYDRKFDISELIPCKVVVSSLFKEVARAEKSAKKYETDQSKTNTRRKK